MADMHLKNGNLDQALKHAKRGDSLKMMGKAWTEEAREAARAKRREQSGYALAGAGAALGLHQLARTNPVLRAAGAVGGIAGKLKHGPLGEVLGRAVGAGATHAFSTLPRGKVALAGAGLGFGASLIHDWWKEGDTYKRLQMAKLQLRLAKQGYYVGLTHNKDKSVQHFICDADNRVSARMQAMQAHPDHSIFRVHERNNKKKGDNVTNLTKIWTDEARKASALARAAHHKDQAKAHRVAIADEESGSKNYNYHRDAIKGHQTASDFYGKAGASYGAGKTAEGDEHVRTAQYNGSKAAFTEREIGTGSKKQTTAFTRKPLSGKDLSSASYGQQWHDISKDPERVKNLKEKLAEKKPEEEKPKKQKKQKVPAVAKLRLIKAIIGTQIEKKLPANASVDEYIHDFVHSSNKKFEGDSKQQRIKRALGAYYSNQ
jgi:hypothetical protein